MTQGGMMVFTLRSLFESAERSGRNAVTIDDVRDALAALIRMRELAEEAEARRAEARQWRGSQVIHVEPPRR